LQSDTAEVDAKSVSRFNVPGRKLPKMPAGDGVRGDSSGSVKPRIARHGYIRFLTLKDLDARSRAAGYAKQLAGALESDLGGADRLSAAQRQLVQRAAVLSSQCEDFETRYLLGEPVELPDYLAATNCLRRVLLALGLDRKPRDITPSLTAYLAAEADRKAASESATEGGNDFPD
jgi:hypothetical protein